MIILATPEDAGSIHALCRQSALGGRISARVSAYGLVRNFFQVWMITVLGRPAGVIAMMDGRLTLVMDKDHNPSPEILADIASFAEITGRILYCDATIGIRLPFCLSDTAQEMKLAPHADGASSPARQSPANGLTFELYPSPKTVYSVMTQCQNKSIVLPPFEPWYLDFSHLSRHGAARSIVLMRHRTAVGTALTAAETGSLAVIGGVCVLPGHQGKGYGKVLLGQMLTSLVSDGKQCRLLCNQPALISFYSRMGLSLCGEVAELDVNTTKTGQAPVL